MSNINFDILILLGEPYKYQNGKELCRPLATFHGIFTGFPKHKYNYQS
jgi:hypothetical protein